MSSTPENTVITDSKSVTETFKLSQNFAKGLPEYLVMLMKNTWAKDIDRNTGTETPVQFIGTLIKESELKQIAEKLSQNIITSINTANIEQGESQRLNELVKNAVIIEGFHKHNPKAFPLNAKKDDIDDVESARMANFFANTIYNGVFTLRNGILSEFNSFSQMHAPIAVINHPAFANENYRVSPVTSGDLTTIHLKKVDSTKPAVTVYFNRKDAPTLAELAEGSTAKEPEKTGEKVTEETIKADRGISDKADGKVSRPVELPH